MAPPPTPPAPLTKREYDTGVLQITDSIKKLGNILADTLKDSTSTRPNSPSSGTRRDRSDSSDYNRGSRFGQEFTAMQQGLQSLHQEFTRIGESFKEFRTLRIENRKSFEEFNRSSSAVIKAVKSQGMMSVLSMREVTSTLMDIERTFIDKYQDISEEEQANIATYINKAAVSLNVEGKRIYSAIELNAKVAKNSSKLVKETLGIASRTDTYFRGKFSEQLWDSLSEREVDFAIMTRGSKEEIARATKEYAAASQVAVKYGVKDLLDKILSSTSGPLDVLTENAAALGKYSNTLMSQYENSDIVGMTETLVKAESEFYKSMKLSTHSALAMQMQLKALGGEFKPTKDFIAEALTGAVKEGEGFAKDFSTIREHIKLGADSSLDEVEHTAGAFIENMEYIGKRFFSLSASLNNLLITVANLSTIFVNFKSAVNTYTALFKELGFVSDNPKEIASVAQPVNKFFDEVIGVDISRETILNLVNAFATHSSITSFYKGINKSLGSIEKFTLDLSTLIFGSASSKFFTNLMKVFKFVAAPLITIGNVVLSTFLSFSRQVIKLLLPNSTGISHFLSGFLGSDSNTLIGAFKDAFTNTKINIIGRDFPIATPEDIEKRKQERQSALDKASQEQRERMKDSDYRFKYKAFQDSVLKPGEAAHTAFKNELDTWKRHASRDISYSGENKFKDWVDRMVLHSIDLQEAINNLDIGERTDIDVLSDTMKEIVPQKIATSIGEVIGKPIIDIYNLLHAYFSRNKIGRNAISSVSSTTTVGAPTAGVPVVGKETFFIDRSTGARVDASTYYAQAAKGIDVSNGIVNDKGITSTINKFWDSKSVALMRAMVENVWSNSIDDKNKDKYYEILNQKGFTPISRSLADVRKAIVDYSNKHITDSESLRRIAEANLNTKTGVISRRGMYNDLLHGYTDKNGIQQGGVLVNGIPRPEGFASEVQKATVGDNSAVENKRKSALFKSFIDKSGGKMVAAGIAISGMLGGAEGIAGALGVGRESATGRLATMIQYALMGASAGAPGGMGFSVPGAITGAIIGLIMSSPAGKRILPTIGKILNNTLSPLMKVFDALLSALEPLINLLVPLTDLITPPLEAFCDVLVTITNLLSGGIKGFVTFIAKLLGGKGNVGFTDWVNNGKKQNEKDHGVSRKYWADTNDWVKSSEKWSANVEENGLWAQHATGGVLTSADGIPIKNGRDNLLVSAQTGERILSRQETNALSSDKTDWMSIANQNQPFVKNYTDYYKDAGSNLSDVQDSSKKSLEIQTVCLSAIQLNTLAILDWLDNRKAWFEKSPLSDAVKEANSNAIDAQVFNEILSPKAAEEEKKRRGLPTKSESKSESKSNVAKSTGFKSVLGSFIGGFLGPQGAILGSVVGPALGALGSLFNSHEDGGVLTSKSGPYFPNGNGIGHDNLFVSAQTGETILSREDSKNLFMAHDKGTTSLSSISINSPLGKQLAFLDWAKKNLPTKSSMEDLPGNSSQSSTGSNNSFAPENSLGLGQGDMSIKDFIKSKNKDLNDATVNHYADLIAYASKELGLDQRVIAAQIAQESNFRTNATSGAGAKGLFQIMDNTWGGRAGNAYDPDKAVVAYVEIMKSKANSIKKLLSTTDFSKMNWDDISKVLSAYNAGQGNVLKYGGVPNFKETKKYIANIKGMASSLQPIDANTNALNENTKALKNQEKTAKKDFKPDSWVKFLSKVGLKGYGFERLSNFLGREFKLNSKTGNIFELTNNGLKKRFKNTNDLLARLNSDLAKQKKNGIQPKAKGTVKNGKIRGLTLADGIPCNNGPDNLWITAQTGEGIIPRDMMPPHAEGTITGYSGNLDLKQILNDVLVVPLLKPMLNANLSNDKKSELLQGTVNQLYSAYQKATGGFIRKIEEYLPNIDNSIDKMFGSSWLGQIGASFTKGISKSLGLNDIVSNAGGILESVAKGDFTKAGEHINDIGKLFGGIGDTISGVFNGIFGGGKKKTETPAPNTSDGANPEVVNGVATTNNDFNKTGNPDIPPGGPQDTKPDEVPQSTNADNTNNTLTSLNDNLLIFNNHFTTYNNNLDTFNRKFIDYNNYIDKSNNNSDVC